MLATRRAAVLRKRSSGPPGQIGPTRLQATRLGTNYTVLHSNEAYFNARSFRYARVKMNKTQIILPGYYVTGGPQGFTGAATVSFTASLEYPAGTFNQFKFNGSTTGSISSLGHLKSDVLNISVPIPKDAKFWIRIYGNFAGALFGGTQGIPVSNGCLAGGDDGMEVSTTPITDKTMGGTIHVDNALFGPFLPIGLIGPNPNAVVICCGDSRDVGAGDTIDASGDMGEQARSIGPALAYCNLGDYGQQAYAVSNYYGTGTTPMIPFNEVYPYGTVVTSCWGFNDLNSSGEDSAHVLKHLLLINAHYNALGLKNYISTLAPGTTSSDSFESAGGQTILTNSSQGGISIQPERLSVNTAIRGGLSTTNLDIGASSWPGVVAGQSSAVQGWWEICNIIEDTFDLGKWKSDGVTPNLFTGDGVHESQFANIAIQNATVVPVSILATYV